MAGVSGARVLSSSIRCVGLGVGVSLSVAACAAPARVEMPSDRAVALYREARADAVSRAREARAGQRDLAPRALGADEAVALARQRSAALAEAKARVDTAAALVDAEAASAYRNPELRVSQLRLDQALDDDARVSAGVRVRPPRPGEADAKVAVARAGEAEARGAARVEELALEADVRWRFDDVLLLDAEIAATEAVATTRRHLADQLKTRVDTSQATAIEEATAALSAVEAEADGAEARERRGVALAQLLERVGIDPGTPVRLVGEPLGSAPLAELPAEEMLVEAALKGRPEIGIAAARLDAAGAKGALARGERWPWFSFVQLGYEFERGTRDPLGWSFAAGLELPIFDTHRSAVLAADAEAAEAKRAFAAEVERIARDVRERLREVRAAGALLDGFRVHALPVAERAGVEAARALDSRQIDALRALSIDERRAAAQLKLLRLVRRYRSALDALRGAVGGPLPASPVGARQVPAAAARP